MTEDTPQPPKKKALLSRQYIKCWNMKERPGKAEKDVDPATKKCMLRSRKLAVKQKGLLHFVTIVGVNRNCVCRVSMKFINNSLSVNF